MSADNEMPKEMEEVLDTLVHKWKEDNKEKELCPVCNSEVVVVGRCKTCYSCGWSTCSL